MKVWITKYALTRGIFELEVDSFDGEYVNGKQSCESYDRDLDEWCETRDEAVLIAEEMKAEQIEHLKNQIEKLEKIKFE